MIGFVFRSETDSDKERPHPYLCFGGGESDDSEERHQLLEVRLRPLRAQRREQLSERRHQGCGGLRQLQLHKDSDGDTFQLLLIIKSQSII